MQRIPARIRLPIILAVLAAISSPASAGSNLLANPGFEAAGGSYDGWSILFGSGPNISTAANDNIFRSGEAASKIFGEFNGCPIPNFDVGGYGQSFTPTAGQMYELSGYSFVAAIDPMTGSIPCASNRCIAKIAFFDAPVGGLEISVNEVTVGDASTPVEMWLPFSVSAVAPAGAMRVEALVLYLQPGCDTGSVFLDDLAFREVNSPVSLPNVLANPSFDTGLTGWSTFGNVLHDTRNFTLHTAPGSAKLFGPFANPGDASGLFQAFSTTPGMDWQLQVWSFQTCQESPIGPAGLNHAVAKIVFRDGGGAEVDSAQTVIVDANSRLGTWTHHNVAGTSPAGAVTAEAFLLFVQPDSTENGAVWVDDVLFRGGVLTDVPVIERQRDFSLGQNVPNPFRPSTRIDFVLAKTAQVELSVYDVAGRHVRTLVDGRLGPGMHDVTWDGTSAGGRAAAAGVYRYVLRTPSGQTSRSMLLLR